MRDRGGLDRIEAAISDARANLDDMARAGERNAPEAWDAARTRFEAHRDRATMLLNRTRARPGNDVASLASIEAALEELERIQLPARPDGIRRVEAEPALEALRTAVCPDDMTRHEWHRWVNARLRAIAEGMAPADSDVLVHRMTRQSPSDPLGRWLASRLNAGELIVTLRDSKRRARFLHR